MRNVAIHPAGSKTRLVKNGWTLAMYATSAMMTRLRWTVSLLRPKSTAEGSLDEINRHVSVTEASFKLEDIDCSLSEEGWPLPGLPS